MRLSQLASIAGLLSLSACATASTSMDGRLPAGVSASAPSPDPRIGLKGGLHDAGEASWNLRLLSATRPSERFVGATNSDLAFTGQYAIQGNYNGYQVWDISDPRRPVLTTAYFCPASQSDVSVYRNLLFVSGESLSGRLDCGPQGVRTAIS
ncbi:MAG: LVIVD repeat-containing protein, partial [Gemmatimonadaceae bacterium]